MDDKQRRQLVMAYMADQFRHIQPSSRNIGLGNLIRLFDNIEGDELESVLPSYIVKHLQALQEFYESEKIDLWCYTLAHYINLYLIDVMTQHIRQDIIEALGWGKVDLMRRYTDEHFGSNCKEIEQSICKGLFSCVLQYYYRKDVPSDLISNIQTKLGDIDYTSSMTLQQYRKRCLIDHLKLDLNNPEHLSFWDDKTNKGAFNTGGKPVCFSHFQFRVPNRIRAMMEAAHSHHGSYEDLVDVLDEIRTKSIGWSSYIQAKYRHEATKLVYESIHLEKVTLNEVDASVTLEQQGVPEDISAPLANESFGQAQAIGTKETKVSCRIV